MPLPSSKMYQELFTKFIPSVLTIDTFSNWENKSEEEATNALNALYKKYADQTTFSEKERLTLAILCKQTFNLIKPLLQVLPSIETNTEESTQILLQLVFIGYPEGFYNFLHYVKNKNAHFSFPIETAAFAIKHGQYDFVKHLAETEEINWNQPAKNHPNVPSAFQKLLPQNGETLTEVLLSQPVNESLLFLFKFLKEKGLSLEEQYTKKNALHILFSSQFFQISDKSAYLDLIKWLIEKGVDPAHRNEFDETPLHIYARNHFFIEGASLLIEAGAEINARNKSGSTPIRYALGSASSSYLFHQWMKKEEIENNEKAMKEIKERFDFILFLIKKGAGLFLEKANTGLRISEHCYIWLDSFQISLKEIFLRDSRALYRAIQSQNFKAADTLLEKHDFNISPSQLSDADEWYPLLQSEFVHFPEGFAGRLSCQSGYASFDFLFQAVKEKAHEEVRKKILVSCFRREEESIVWEKWLPDFVREYAEYLLKKKVSEMSQKEIDHAMWELLNEFQNDYDLLSFCILFQKEEYDECKTILRSRQDMHKKWDKTVTLLNGKIVSLYDVAREKKQGFNTMYQIFEGIYFYNLDRLYWSIAFIPGELNKIKSHLDAYLENFKSIHTGSKNQTVVRTPVWSHAFDFLIMAYAYSNIRDVNNEPNPFVLAVKKNEKNVVSLLLKTIREKPADFPDEFFKNLFEAAMSLSSPSKEDMMEILKSEFKDSNLKEKVHQFYTYIFSSPFLGVLLALKKTCPNIKRDSNFDNPPKRTIDLSQADLNFIFHFFFSRKSLQTRPSYSSTNEFSHYDTLPGILYSASILLTDEELKKIIEIVLKNSDSPDQLKKQILNELICTKNADKIRPGFLFKIAKMMQVDFTLPLFHPIIQQARENQLTVIQGNNSFLLANFWDRSFFYKAIENGNKESVSIFLQEGFELKTDTPDYECALRKAIDNGHEEILNFLHQSGFLFLPPSKKSISDQMTDYLFYQGCLKKKANSEWDNLFFGNLFLKAQGKLSRQEWEALFKEFITRKNLSPSAIFYPDEIVLFGDFVSALPLDEQRYAVVASCHFNNSNFSAFLKQKLPRFSFEDRIQLTPVLNPRRLACYQEKIRALFENIEATEVREKLSDSHTVDCPEAFKKKNKTKSDVFLSGISKYEILFEIKKTLMGFAIQINLLSLDSAIKKLLDQLIGLYVASSDQNSFLKKGIHVLSFKSASLFGSKTTARSKTEEAILECFRNPVFGFQPFLTEEILAKMGITWADCGLKPPKPAQEIPFKPSTAFTYGSNNEL